MKNVNSINPNDFEFTIFELISEDGDCNTPFFNHQLHKLYARYQTLATRLSYKYHLDKDLAGDVLQDGILLLLKRIQEGRFEFNPEYGFKSFLYRTFQNLSMNMNKKSKGFPSAELQYLAEQDREDADYVEAYPPIAPSCKLEDRVEELLEEKLGESAAMVLYLSLIEHKTNAEGAQIMRYKNEGVFRKKKSKHLRDLRARIDEQQQAELMRMAS